MAEGYTVTQAQAQLDAWLAANLAIAERGQSYEINTGNGSRQLDRADLTEIRAQIVFWRREVERLTPRVSRSRTRYFVPE